jgi:hypothetical protein
MAFQVKLQNKYELWTHSAAICHVSRENKKYLFLLRLCDDNGITYILKFFILYFFNALELFK